MSKKGVHTNIQIAQTSPVAVAITPLAMAYMSDDLFSSSESFTPKKRFPLINFFLYSASIELGLKAAILAKDCNKQNKKKIKKINHDLDKLIEEFERICREKMFTDDELKVIHQVNIFYSENSKALEYFTTPMLEQALKSFKEFPKIKDFRKVAVKVNQFIVDNDYFINATTSEKPSQGIIAIN